MECGSCAVQRATRTGWHVQGESNRIVAIAQAGSETEIGLRRRNFDAKPNKIVARPGVGLDLVNAGEGLHRRIIADDKGLAATDDDGDAIGAVVTLNLKDVAVHQRHGDRGTPTVFQGFQSWLEAGLAVGTSYQSRCHRRLLGWNEKLRLRTFTARNPSAARRSRPRPVRNSSCSSLSCAGRDPITRPNRALH